MKQQHTHGPWKVNEHSEVTFKDGRICDVDYYNVGRGEKGRYQLPHEANARLIAAAPELLEALKVIIGKEITDHELFVAIQNASKLIAKIEGDESNT